jgi:hypothetical protein
MATGLAVGGDVEQALRSVGVPSYVLDTTGVVRWINEAAERLVGDVRGRLFTSVVAPEDSRRLDEVESPSLRRRAAHAAAVLAFPAPRDKVDSARNFRERSLHVRGGIGCFRRLTAAARPSSAYPGERSEMHAGGGRRLKRTRVPARPIATALTRSHRPALRPMNVARNVPAGLAVLYTVARSVSAVAVTRTRSCGRNPVPASVSRCVSTSRSVPREPLWAGAVWPVATRIAPLPRTRTRQARCFTGPVCHLCPPLGLPSAQRRRERN